MLGHTGIRKVKLSYAMNFVYLEQNLHCEDAGETVIEVGQLFVPSAVGVHRVLGGQSYWRTDDYLIAGKEGRLKN